MHLNENESFLLIDFGFFETFLESKTLKENQERTRENGINKKVCGSSDEFTCIPIMA